MIVELRLSPFLVGVLIMTMVAAISPNARAKRIWFDGSSDDATGPPGKLLSDNIGYWGDVVLTGVTYKYQNQPDASADVASFGGPVPNRLIDGRTYGYKVGVGSGPLAVVFDFKRRCTFHEIDLATATDPRVATKLEVSFAGPTNWRMVYERSYADCPPGNLHRLLLTEKPEGRYLRLTMRAKTSTRLDEVWVWGDAPRSAATSRPRHTGHGCHANESRAWLTGLSPVLLKHRSLTTSSTPGAWGWEKSAGILPSGPMCLRGERSRTDRSCPPKAPCWNTLRSPWSAMKRKMLPWL